MGSPPLVQAHDHAEALTNADGNQPTLPTDVHTYLPVRVFVMLNAVLMASCLCLMVGAGQPGGGGGTRHLNQWAPDMEPRYTFAMWQRDVFLWMIANGDIEPHRQTAMLLMQLRGGARELTQELPDDIILRGGVINGHQVDGVTYIMNLLAERYAQLGEEVRLKAITDIMTFDRRPHERIDDLLTRFEVTRQRAQENGSL